MNNRYEDRFGGIARLYGTHGLERLRQSHVCIIGIGGVGSWTVEALARSGVGRLTLIDLDDVCVSNINRQLHALDGTVGQAKIDVMAARVALIQPSCEVHTVSRFFTASTAENLLSQDFDYVVDAIDDLRNKALLLSMCHARNIPVVTVGGAGGLRNPAAIKIDDLAQSGGDGLLRETRRILRNKYGFANVKSWGIPCVFSPEKAVYPSPDGDICDKPSLGESLRMDCASGFGAATFVTGAFGFAAASVVVNALTQDPTP